VEKGRINHMKARLAVKSENAEQAGIPSAAPFPKCMSACTFLNGFNQPFITSRVSVFHMKSRKLLKNLFQRKRVNKLTIL
jgi:hypothetical protein